MNEKNVIQKNVIPSQVLLNSTDDGVTFQKAYANFYFFKKK